MLNKFNKIIFLISISILINFLFCQKVFAQNNWQALKISQSQITIPEIAAGDSFTFWVKFKNTGAYAWNGTGPERVMLRTISGMKSKFAHSRWFSNNAPGAINPSLSIFPNQEILFKFPVLAPQKAGLYWEKFELFHGSTPIQGGIVEIPIRVIAVTETPPPQQNITPPPSGQEPSNEKEKFWQLISPQIDIKEKISQEPKIRIGLLYIEEDEDKQYLPLKISTLNHSPYDIYDKNNFLLIRNTQGEPTEITYDRNINRYFINNAKGIRLLMTDSYLKLRGFIQPKTTPIFKINNWKNGPSWDSQIIDNEFKNYLEVQYNPATQRIWLINQLPMEDYLKGLTEASDNNPQEFLKAQIVAARTYAMFRINNPKYINTPNKKPLFDLRSTQADQVYRGYQRELRSPNSLKAINETKGIIITYHNSPISAYYFAQSDGKTRDSYKVGMTKNPVPYLISKNDPPGKGKTLLGHGVGMPQRSAIKAAQEGANFSQILKYYYTGIELTKIY